MSDGGRPTYLRRVVMTAAVAVLAVLAVALVWRAAETLLLLFAGVLLATALQAPTAYLVRRMSAPFALAFAIVLVAFFAIIVGWLFLFESQLVRPTGELARQVPEGLGELRERLEQEPWGPWLLERTTGGSVDATGGASLASQLVGTVTTLWDVAAKLLFVFFAGVFLAASPARYRDGVLRLLPVARRDRARVVANEIGRTLRGWILGRLVAMAIVGVLSWIGLRLVGVPAAGGLALIAAMLEFVPYLGPVLALVPAALLALTQGVPTVVAVTVLFAVIYQLEGNLLTPLVQQRTALVPPVVTVAAIFVGAAVFGVVGMLVATPLAAVVLVLVKMLYLHDVLGQPVELLSGLEAGLEDGDEDGEGNVDVDGGGDGDRGGGRSPGAADEELR